jgi:uncharacterized protein RhaS with RHS repeats
VFSGERPGKEQDDETGLLYFGARYLDPEKSMWLSADPAMGEYVPSAPVDDEAKKSNGNLPGMGGVFNYANLHTYHYAGNNPVNLVDPDGEWIALKKQNDRFNGYIDSGVKGSVSSDYKGEGFGTITIKSIAQIRRDAELNDTADLQSRFLRDIHSAARELGLGSMAAEKYENEEMARYKALKSIREKSDSLVEMNGVMEDARITYNSVLGRGYRPEDKKRADDAANEIIDNYIKSKDPSYQIPIKE